MTHHGTEDRIRCPRCNVNNFPGVIQCWHCGAALPQAPAGAGASHAHPRSARLPTWLPILALVVLVIVGGVLYGMYSRSRAPATSVSAHELRDLERRLLRSSELRGTPAPTGLDAVEVRARQELERLKQQASILEDRKGGAIRGGPPPGLRISPEEWERTGRDLRGIQ